MLSLMQPQFSRWCLNHSSWVMAFKTTTTTWKPAACPHCPPLCSCYSQSSTFNIENRVRVCLFFFAKSIGLLSHHSQQSSLVKRQSSNLNHARFFLVETLLEIAADFTIVFHGCICSERVILSSKKLNIQFSTDYRLCKKILILKFANKLIIIALARFLSTKLIQC